MSWLCKIGVHRWKEILNQEDSNWWPPTTVGYKCERCGHQICVESDCFDGTDGY
jgi:hypothetical protein